MFSVGHFVFIALSLVVIAAAAHWLIYLLIRLVSALIVIVLVNLPLLKKEKRSRKTHA